MVAIDCSAGLAAAGLPAWLSAGGPVLDRARSLAADGSVCEWDLSSGGLLRFHPGPAAAAGGGHDPAALAAAAAPGGGGGFVVATTAGLVQRWGALF